MGTFLYSPQIRVHVSTLNHGIVDLSGDLTQGTLTIRTNGVHTFNFQLQNSQRKYDGVLRPMDRITVEMFRVSWVRVFSGYLNNGPIFSAWPRVLSMSASCSLKRLQFFFWDSSAPASSALIDSTLGTGRQTPYPATTAPGANTPAKTAGPTSEANDSAITQTVINLLTKVVNWPQEKIHIAAIPADWSSAAAAFGKSALVAADMTGLLGDFTSTAGLDALVGPVGAAPAGTGGSIGGAPLTQGSGKQLPAGNYGGSNLSAEAATNAALIASIGANRGLDGKAQQIAIAAAMQESGLRNLHYGDRNSQGLFQMRPSAGWGTVAQVTDPVYATNKFYDTLLKVPGWQNMSVTQAAQAVERSAYPDAYAKWGNMAAALVQASTGSGGTVTGPGGATDPNGATAGAAGQAAGSGEPLARAVDNSLLNIYAWGLTPANIYGQVLAGPRALMNDQPILPYIANLMASTMRSWCSAPNGDFISWFPDYFGIWNSASKMNIEPIELMDFTVEWNDQEIVTHQYVVGAPGAMVNRDTAEVESAAEGGFNWATTSSGIATADMPGIFALIFGSDPGPQFATDYLSRFGGRPDLLNTPLIQQGTPEFVMALYLFMQRWANQFKANVPMTFMPELWPGMLLCIPAYSFQAYITQVQHTFQFGKGGGFYTTAQICAPARTSDHNPSTMFGLLPLAGSARPAGSATTSANTGVGNPATQAAGGTQ